MITFHNATINHCFKMEFLVTKSNGNLVPPCSPTPSSTLDLSRIDRLPVLRCNARTLHVFEEIGPRGVALSTIREALSKALVPYFPLAGRLSSNGSNIDCTADGVWFVEAVANCSLRSVGYFEDVTSIPFDELLPSHPHENQCIDPLVLMQVCNYISLHTSHYYISKLFWFTLFYFRKSTLMQVYNYPSYFPLENI